MLGRPDCTEHIIVVNDVGGGGGRPASQSHEYRTSESEGDKNTDTI